MKKKPPGFPAAFPFGGDIMTIILYKMSSENNRLDKTNFLGSPLTINNAVPKGAFRVDAADFAITYPGDLSGYNYAKITVDGTDYYYFVTITGDLGQQLKASCKRDPLYSFMQAINPLPIIADRTTKQAIEAGQIGFNSMLSDNLQKVLVNQQIQRKPVMNFAWSANYTVVTVG